MTRRTPTGPGGTGDDRARLEELWALDDAVEDTVRAMVRGAYAEAFGRRCSLRSWLAGVARDRVMIERVPPTTN